MVEQFSMPSKICLVLELDKSVILICSYGHAYLCRMLHSALHLSYCSLVFLQKAPFKPLVNQGRVGFGWVS
jgi:hypothetical protein